MAFSDDERVQYSAQASAFCERRVPVRVHDKLWMGFKIEGQSIVLLEFRPHWEQKFKIVQRPVAKTTFVRSADEWRIYWLRQDLKWHGYQPCPTAESFEEFLEEVTRDECCCFFG